MANIYSITKNTRPSVMFFLFLYFYGITLERKIETIEEVAKQFVNEVNSYKSSKEYPVILTNQLGFIIQNLSLIFTPSKTEVSKYVNSINYSGVNVTFLFDIIFINQPYINDARKGKSIEITIPKIASYLQIPTIQLNKLSDNSYEDEGSHYPREGSINLQCLQELTLYKNEIERFQKTKYLLVFMGIWYDILNSVLTKYPVCTSYYNFLELEKHLINTGYIDVKYAPDPYFKKLKFNKITYKNIIKEHSSFIKLEYVTLDIEYYLVAYYHKPVYFDFLIFTPNDITFGYFSPIFLELEDIIKMLIKNELSLIISNQ